MTKSMTVNTAGIDRDAVVRSLKRSSRKAYQIPSFSRLLEFAGTSKKAHEALLALFKVSVGY